LIPVRGQPSSIVNPFRRKSLSSATEEESSCAPVWEHSSLRRTCCRLPLRPLRAGPRFARLKPMPRGRSSCPTVAMASGGLFIGATRRGANGFGFGGARRTDEFEPAQVRGRATPPEARSGAYLMQNSRATGLGRKRPVAQPTATSGASRFALPGDSLLLKSGSSMCLNTSSSAC